MKYLILLLLPYWLFAQTKVVLNETTDVLDLGNGLKQAIISGAPRFYKDLPDTTQWQVIDNRWVDSTNYWVIYKNEYKIRVKKSFTANDLFEFQLEPNDITFQPDDLIVDSTTTYSPLSVTGYLKDSFTIRFENCYASGIHMEITGINGLKINKIIDSMAFPLGGGYLPKGAGGLSKSFEFKFKISKEKNVKIKDWDSTKIGWKKDIDLGLNKYRIGNIKGNRELVKADWKLDKQGNKKYISKSISVGDFRGLITDLSLELGAQPDFDIYGLSLSGTFSTRTSGTKTNNDGVLRLGFASDRRRYVCMFNTSSIAGNTPSDITFKFVTATTNIGSSYEPIMIVKYTGTSASDSTLDVASILAKFDGNKVFHTSSNFNLFTTDMTTYNNCTLNSTALTEYTTIPNMIALGVVCKSDYDNTTPSNDEYYQAKDNISTSGRPLLSITYSSAGGGSGLTTNKKQQHIINMKTP